MRGPVTADRGDRMRVLGVDPGLTRCGLGVVDGLPGRQPRLIAVDVVRTPAELDTARRLVLIEEARGRLDHRTPTDRGRHRAGLRPAQRADRDGYRPGRRGGDAGGRPGAASPVSLHTPSEVKAAITGSGRASKDQVGAMVTRILRLEEAPRPADAADALALAICHVWRGGTTARLDAAMEAAAASRPGSAAGLPAGRGVVIASGQRTGAAGRPDVGGGRGRRARRPRARAAPTPWPACGSASGRPWPPSLIVREDSLTLYGFASADEREFFELLLTATGVGPKLAQAALAVLSPDELRQAIATENLVQLCKVPGIGRKGAQRIVIELKDKINAVALPAEPGRRPGAAGRLARPGDPGPAGSGLVGPRRRGGLRRGGAAGGRGSRRRCAGADARGAAEPGPPMSDQSSLVRTETDPERAGRRVGAPTDHAWPSSRASRGSATSSGWCSRRPGTAAAWPTTCCSPGRRAWARPPWP